VDLSSFLLVEIVLFLRKVQETFIMKFNLLNLFVVCLLSALFYSCSEEAKVQSEGNKSEDKSFSEVKLLAQEWNQAHLKRDVGIFAKVYSDRVFYYGSDYDKNSCIQSKLNFFKKHPEYVQNIKGDIQVERIESNKVKCSFTKEVFMDGKMSEFPSYLVFAQVNEGWKIDTESDLVTDGNLAKRNSSSSNIPQGAVKGDYNGDGEYEYMWLIEPKLTNDEMNCVGSCASYIKFSDSRIHDIKIEDCIGGSPYNHGDLNGNGTDEIGLLPGWFTSCWRDYLVWTFKNGNWIYAVDPITTHCNLWDSGVEPIAIDRNRPGNVLIHFSEYTEEDIIILSKSVPIVR
jgi:hypothetical protein